MSSFIDVQNAPEKQWVDNVTLTVLSVGQITQDKYGFKQQIQVRDETGHECPFRVQSQYENGMMDVIDVNMALSFRVKWYNSKVGAQVCGYCTRTKQQAPQQDTGGTPMFGAKMSDKAPLNQRQVAPAFNKARDYDKENRGKCRFGFLQALVQAKMEPKKILEDKELLLDIEALVELSMGANLMTTNNSESQAEDTTDYSQEEWENS